MNGDYGWTMMWMLVWLFIVVAVLAVAVFAVVRLARPRQESYDGAQELLRRLYAAGEIDKDEYVSREADLGRPR